MIPDIFSMRRTALQHIADTTEPHTTVRCWRVVTDQMGVSWFCGAILIHYPSALGRTLTLCPECDLYDERSDR